MLRKLKMLNLLFSEMKVHTIEDIILHTIIKKEEQVTLISLTAGNVKGYEIYLK